MRAGICSRSLKVELEERKGDCKWERLPVSVHSRNRGPWVLPFWSFSFFYLVESFQSKKCCVLFNVTTIGPAEAILMSGILWNSRKGERREWAPQICPLTSRYTLGHIYPPPPHPHTSIVPWSGDLALSDTLGVVFCQYWIQTRCSLCISMPRPPKCWECTLITLCESLKFWSHLWGSQDPGSHSCIWQDFGVAQ